ncbi:MAG TPA: TolC family protein [Opitutaceae bacterium]
MSRSRSRTYLPFALIAALALQPVAHAATLTLREALEAVDRTSITVLLSREAAVQAIAASQQQRAALMPNVNLNASQNRSSSASFSNGNVTQNSPTNRFSGTLNATLNLLDAQNIASYSASKIAINVAELDVNVARETVTTTVAQTYFQHLRNLRRIAVLDANIARAKALLELAKTRAETGVATQIDVTRAEAVLATAEQARLQQETVVQSSELNLKQLLDLDLNEPLTLADFAVRRVEAPTYAASIEQTAFERRYDYLRAVKLLEQNKLEVKAAKFDRLPSLAITGNVGLSSEVIFDDENADTWAGGVSLSMPIFDSGRVRNLTNLALSRLRAQELRVRNLRLQIGAEVRLASQDARSRFAQVAVAERSLRLAQDELALAQRRFEQGVADNREVIDAQNSLAVASDNVVEAFYQYNLSRVTLARTSGDVRLVLNEQSN